MKNFKILILITLLLPLIITSCSVEPKEINYGTDHCHYCDMTVVSKTHASEYVTKKGKAFMFDAIECMVNEINDQQNEDGLAFVLVANYANPGELVDARKATFLISQEIKSPMGAYLSAFNSFDKAKSTQTEHGGDLYTWEELKDKFSK